MALSNSDRVEIAELLSRYGLLMDRQRTEEWMDLFVNDAALDIEGRPLLSSADDRLDLAHTAPHGTHLSAPPVISEGALPETARTEQAFIFRNRAEGSFLGGWYEDDLVKADGRWRFQRRTIRFHQ
jgi:3-phenylpropionate/cinnamic acid dioxygenase small subunit